MVQLDDRRRGQLGERVIEAAIRTQSVSAGVTGGDRRLQGVRAEPTAEPLSPLQRGEASTDGDVVPPPRSWSSSRIGSPDGPTRARNLDA